MDSKSYTKAKLFLLKILENNTITTKDEIVKKIKNYKTKEGKNLSTNTLKLLIYTANKYFKKKFLLYSDFNLNNCVNTNIAYYYIKPEIEHLIRTTVTFFCNYLQYTKYKTVKSDTALSVALSICTNLRMAELIQLSVEHLQDIARGKNIAIKIKKKQTSSIILTNKLLYLHFLPFFLKLANSTERVIKSSKSSINATFREKLISFDINNVLEGSKNLFGIQSVRRINTTELLTYNLNPKLVQLFNRHKNVSTCLQNYNTLFGAASTLSAIYKK